MLYPFLDAWEISWFPSSWWEDNLFFVLLWVLHIFNYFGFVSFPQLQDIFTGICWSILCSVLRMNFCTVLSLSVSFFLYLWGCVCLREVHYSILQTQLSTLLAFLKIHFNLLNSGRLLPSWLSHPAAYKLSLILSDNNEVQLVYSLS